VDVSDPLIWWRAFHFAATALLAGALLFWILVHDAAVFGQRRVMVPPIVRDRLAAVAIMRITDLKLRHAAVPELGRGTGDERGDREGKEDTPNVCILSTPI